MDKIRVLWLVGILFMVFSWYLVGIWVNHYGKARIQNYEQVNPSQQAIILFNPDPIYNLDEQVGQAFAEGLWEKDWAVQLATVQSKHTIDPQLFDLIVFCANTYNFAPDQGTIDAISDFSIEGKPIVALTLGSGTTSRAHRILKNHIERAGGDIVAEKQLWLMRPNDESRLDESNIEVAKDIAKEMASHITLLYTSTSPK